MDTRKDIAAKIQSAANGKVVSIRSGGAEAFLVGTQYTDGIYVRVVQNGITLFTLDQRNLDAPLWAEVNPANYLDSMGWK